jgi:hypothetical protein
MQYVLRMEKFTLAAATAALFVVAKTVESRISRRDATPVRTMVRDATLVAASALAATYVAETVMSASSKSGSPGAYVNAPEF